MAKNGVLLTEGSIRRGIVAFAFPIFLGSLFQQLYNLADAMIVGNVLGDMALASVTGTTSTINLFIGFFTGMFTGTGVIISKYYGAGDESMAIKSVNTAVILGALSGLLLTIIGVFLSPIIVDWIGVPAEISVMSTQYLRMFFGGVFFMALYNTACGIFRALGDSKRPFYYLLVASVLNVVLDILFVGILGYGVASAAFATVLAQGFSALLAFRRLCTTDKFYRLEMRKLQFDTGIMKQMLHVGIPAGIQNCVISFANVVVQSTINQFGAIVIAGAGVYTKISGLVMIPIEAFGMSMTTFTSQNMGAGEWGRARKGANFGVGIACLLAALIGVGLITFGDKMMIIFGSSPEAIEVGMLKVKVEAGFLAVLAFVQVSACVLRGAGKAKVPMFTTLGCWCVLRLLYIWIVTAITTDVLYVFCAYPFSWVVSAFIMVYQYIKLLKYFKQKEEEKAQIINA